MSEDFDRLLRESVHDLASEGEPVDLSRPALRRARRTRTVRTVSAATAAVIAVLLIAGIAAAARLARTDEDPPPADDRPSPTVSTGSASASSTESAGPRTAPITLPGGWMIRSAPHADNGGVIVYDDATGRYRSAGYSNTVLPSPDGRHLVVMTQTDLVIQTLPGERVVYQRNSASNDVRPVWSADSKRVAFVTWSPDGVRVRVAEVATGLETASELMDCPSGCILKWLEDGEHIRVYTGSEREEYDLRSGFVGNPSATPDDPCGPTVRAFRVDQTSWLCVTRNGFAVTTRSGTVTRRIPFPKSVNDMPVEADSVNYVLSRAP